MLRGLTAKQFLEWEAYAQLEPFGEVRADYRAASICKVIADVNRGKDQQPYKLEDFVLKFREEPERKQTWQDQKAVAMFIAQSYQISHRHIKDT